MSEGVITSFQNINIDTGGIDILNEVEDLPPQASFSVIVDGHDEPLYLESEDGTQGPPIGRPYGALWRSGPYHAGGQAAPTTLKAVNRPTSSNVYVVWDDSDSFEHGASGGEIGALLGYIEARKLEMSGDGSDQPVEFVSEEHGEAITRAINGDDGWIDVRSFTEAAIATNADVNSGGGNSVDVNVEGLRTRSATEQDLITKTVDTGDGEVEVFRGDISDLSWIRAVQNASADDHSHFATFK